MIDQHYLPKASKVIYAFDLILMKKMYISNICDFHLTRSYLLAAYPRKVNFFT